MTHLVYIMLSFIYDMKDESLELRALTYLVYIIL